ncbi:hypothetical protein GAYE_SCF13G3454 [Galdieria yellowstonensis]|uniref:PSII 6.1 kDa protein n=1 Tax=Galdieria yellowstonensis TaxID=3028027 RepID=A0AAV9IEC2_9RHOD|nr:hypothetical protein GAYE_SCF13G3454 [Galdieria yellowstonensis]
MSNNINAFINPLFSCHKVSFQDAKKSICWQKKKSRPVNPNSLVIQSVASPPVKANKLFQISCALTSAFAYSSHCLATEGTGEPLGVDDPRVLVVLTIIPILVFLLWLQFNGQQSNDDFLDTYDQRRR